jgi:hypothetical protein
VTENIQQICPIWETPANVRAGTDSLIVSSPRAGGEYEVTGSAEGSVRRLAPDGKARLTWWLVEQRRQGEARPQISSNTLDMIRSLPLPGILERRDRILDFIAARSPTIAARFPFAGEVTDELRKLKLLLAAHTASQSDAEVNDLLQFAREDHLLEGPDVLHLTFKNAARDRLHRFKVLWRCGSTLR